MNTRLFLAGAMAVLALAGCKKANSAGPVASEQPIKITQASPPQGGNWTDVVNATPAGFMMGNPNAKVKLIEIGSLFCPVCKKFEDDGVPTLIGQYVKSGQVSWEFRPYIIHGPIDMAANLIARCAGPKAFFPFSQSLYRDQPILMSKLEAAPKDKVAEIQNLPTNRVFVEIANVMGLQDWSAARGVSQARSNQCLADDKMINNEVQLTSDVSTQYPDFSGTPAFVINGKMSKDTHSWELLEPLLKDALK